MKTVIIHPLLLRELINRVDTRQAKLPVDDVILEVTLLLPRMFSLMSLQ